MTRSNAPFVVMAILLALLPLACGDSLMTGGLSYDAGGNEAGRTGQTASDSALVSDTNPINPPTVTCTNLLGADTAAQVQIVEGDTTCAKDFVALLLWNPPAYLPAFYQLIPSLKATEALFSAAYAKMTTGAFKFSAPTVLDDLFAKLPAAVKSCTGAARCADWQTYFVNNLLIGAFYLCPTDVATRSEAQLFISIPYGDYYCIESIAAPLGALVSNSTVTQLLNLAATHAQGWSRRNGVRLIGRLAEGTGGAAAKTLVTSTMKTEVTTALLTRLGLETSADVLNDLIWILDSFFYPFLEMMPHLEKITADKNFDSSLRFRAISAWARLLTAKSSLLSSAELNFIISSLSSDDSWVRAEAAYICETVAEPRLDAAMRTQLINALQARWSVETVLVTKIYIARALDHFNGTTLAAQLRANYEAQHLANSVSGNGVVIKSGLAAAELTKLIKLLDAQRAAFFAILGTPFNTPVSGDVNSTITVLIFATRAEYQEYMEGFVGYGANAGGLYLEGAATLYTYQRTSQESIYTLEELLQHEYSHALQARYIYVGKWGVGDFLSEPKGWSDEGLAEFFAGLIFDDAGNYTSPLRAKVLNSLCPAPYRDLPSLLALRIGYDQAGTFDYNNAWAFTYYLLTKQKSVALNVYNAHRNNTYTLANFATIAGTSISTLQTSWHAEMSTWCAGQKGPQKLLAENKRPTAEPGYALRMGALPSRKSPRPSPPLAP